MTSHTTVIVITTTTSNKVPGTVSVAVVLELVGFVVLSVAAPAGAECVAAAAAGFVVDTEAVVVVFGAAVAFGFVQEPRLPGSAREGCRCTRDKNG